MKNYKIIVLLLTFFTVRGIHQEQGRKDYMKNVKLSVLSDMTAKESVQKKILGNGMTILVKEVHTIPKVSLQIWYNVGSKDEKIGEKGLAHLIEHMIFKGTEKLSESDINMLTHKLSGYCNAFTSYDYTGYLFNFPTHHWKEALPVIADCMLNCTFKDDMLNSEIKAVIQELKMNKDRYQRVLIQELISAIFPDHPYHYPIIGYKHDLWNVSSNDLHAFYKSHYLPNNATLVVVGDVNSGEVFQLADQFFGTIPADLNYRKDVCHFTQDIVARAVTIYRDIKQPLVIYSFIGPGAKAKKDNILQIIHWIIGKGRSSRLYKKLVDERQFATSVEAGYWDLFDHSIFFIICEPKNEKNIVDIEQCIIEEIGDLVKNGVTDQEMNRAIKQAQMSLYALLEDIEDQASQIAHYYLATGDENYAFTCLQESFDQLKIQTEELIRSYLRPTIMHKGMILPLPEQEKGQWLKLQRASDEEDEHILSARLRISAVEPPSYAHKISVKEPAKFNFPKAKKFTLSNGLKILYHHNDNTPKVDLILEFKARYYYDPDDKQGLYNFVSKMILEGTKNYTAQQLADIIESRGMSLSSYPGGIAISMLSDDFIFGLQILEEILNKSMFEQQEIEKVRAQILADIKCFWDEPRYFGDQLIKEQLYKGHPYSKNYLGSKNSVQGITRDDLVHFYKKYISPHGAKLAIVGNLGNCDLRDMSEKVLGTWYDTPIESIKFPSLDQLKAQEINYHVNRDQVMLGLARLSIDRKHPDYDKLLIFNQIFGGGLLGSMSSRLFQLREESGLFYTIKGSLLVGSNEQPGMFQVRTIVSLDRLQEAEKAIKKVIDSAADRVTSEEFVQAKRAIVNSLVDNFTSNSNIAQALLYLDRFGLPTDYFDSRAINLDNIAAEDMQKAVKNVLRSDDLLTLRVGRI